MADLVARATMLIRRPRAEVFNAFVQPQLITKFWLKVRPARLLQARRSSGSSWCRAPRRQSRYPGSMSHTG